MDIRNAKTRKAVISALLRLLDTRSLTEVSIDELSKAAGVSRSTFYRNYTSLSDVFVGHVEDWFARFEADLKTEVSGNSISEFPAPENYVALFFDALCEDRAVQIVFKGGGGQEALQLAYSRLRKINSELLKADFGNNLTPYDRELVATVFAAAVMRVSLEADVLENAEYRRRLSERLAVLIDTGVRGLEISDPL